MPVVVDQVSDLARRTIVSGLSSTLRSAPPVPGPEFTGPPGDPGLFGPDSPAWEVHADPAMLVAGIRALLLQLFHPLAMAGVADHSDYRRDPAGRLNRTAGFVTATTYGNTEAAQAAIDMVKAVHIRVRGTAPDGRPYAAGDPHLLLWVHAAEVDSFLRAYQRYGRRPLSPEEADRYVADMGEVALRLGSDVPPRTVAGLRAWLRGMRPALQVGEQAREASSFILNPPGLPLAARPPYAIVAAAAVGLLPGWARLRLRVPPLPLVDRLAVTPAGRLLVGSLAWATGGSPFLDAARNRVAAP
jgi:uncharacterized protein (DUF2236 family)